jgi:hypothetical protein
MSCLQQLQKTNPNLLLTASELRKAERDARFVPAVSMALASILSNSVTPRTEMIDNIQSWDESKMPIVVSASQSQEEEEDEDEDQHSSRDNQVKALASLIQNRFRLVLSQSGKTKPRQAKANKKSQLSQESDASESQSLGQAPGIINWDLLDQDDESNSKEKKEDDSFADFHSLDSERRTPKKKNKKMADTPEESYEEWSLSHDRI